MLREAKHSKTCNSKHSVTTNKSVYEIDCNPKRVSIVIFKYLNLAFESWILCCQIRPNLIYLSWRQMMRQMMMRACQFRSVRFILDHHHSQGEQLAFRHGGLAAYRLCKTSFSDNAWYYQAKASSVAFWTTASVVGLRPADMEIGWTFKVPLKP